MIQALISEIWPYIVGLAGIVAGLFYARQSGKEAGRREVEKQKVEQVLKGIQDAREARSEIDAMDDDAVRDRARQRMRKRSR